MSAIKSLRLREIEEDMISRYGGTMSIRDVGEELKLASYRAINKWLSDVPALRITGTHRIYRTDAVAKKIYYLERV